MPPADTQSRSATAIPACIRLSSRKRFLWGGLGALAPILLSLTMLDISTLERYVNELHGAEMQLRLAGYSIRLVLLFLLGGIWASLHRLENDPRKLFQLGIVAPAMITAMINTNNAIPGNTEVAYLPATNFSISLIPSAHASDEIEKAPEPGPIDLILKGFLGR